MGTGCVGIQGEDDSYDFGSGAGFYVDATEEKWSKHYRMYSYITKEVNITIRSCNFVSLNVRSKFFNRQIGCYLVVFSVYY